MGLAPGADETFYSLWNDIVPSQRIVLIIVSTLFALALSNSPLYRIQRRQRLTNSHAKTGFL